MKCPKDILGLSNTIEKYRAHKLTRKVLPGPSQALKRTARDSSYMIERVKHTNNPDQGLRGGRGGASPPF